MIILMIKYIIIFCLILLIIIFNKKVKHTENYDARVSDTDNLAKCGNMCSSVYGCGGFAHNKSLEKCYLSKFPITSPPIPSLYSGEYKGENVYCNKMFPINSDYSINNDMYVDNKVYDCYTKNAEDLGTKYLDFGSNEKNISKNDVYSLKSDPYELQYLEWPDTRKDINFDKDLIIMYDESKIIYEGDQDNEYKGEYLYPSKCKTDIKLDKCLKDCTQTSKCVAVEYNPKFKEYKNVCCLKSTIGDKIKRRATAESGTMYIKKISNFNDSNKNNIII